MRILIGNLSDDVKEDELRQVLSVFAPVEAIKLFRESGTPTALIEMEMTRERAEALAKRIDGRAFEGRPLRAWVPKMGWE